MNFFEIESAASSRLEWRKTTENFRPGKLEIFIGMGPINIILKEKKHLFLRKRYPRFQNKKSGTCAE